jgi:predicted nucleic acid-binding protein
MVVLDSSGWLEFFLAGPRREALRECIKDQELLVPAAVVYEVYRILRQKKGKVEAMLAVAQMTEHRVADTTQGIAIAAAEDSIEHGLAMADATIYATARLHEATLVTSDFHFEALPNVRYIPRA